MPSTRTSWCAIVLAASCSCLSGVACAAAQLQVSRSAIDFGLVGSSGRSSVQPFFLMNTGDAPLVLTGMTLAGAQALDFHIETTCLPPVTLPPGARCRVDTKVQLASTNPATRVATLTLASDALPPADIGLRATYEGDITQGFVPSPAFVDFVDVPMGSSSTATLTLTNPESNRVLIESVAVTQGDTQDFSVSSDCPGTTSADGASCTATIVFTPTAAGPRSTTLELRFHPIVAPTFHVVYRYSVTGIGTSGANGAVVNLDQQGLTGSWFKPSTSGQGIELEVFEDLAQPGVGLLQGSWFTFDATAAGGAEHGRWYTFGGAVQAGTNTASLPLYQNVGGNFNAPPPTDSAQVGVVSLSVVDCASARLDYTFTDGRPNPSGSLSLVRLTPNVLCDAPGSASGPSDFGLSGNWYDAAKSGQGMVVEVNPQVPVVFFAWYTYAVNGESQGAAGQRWYTGQASYTPGTRSIPLALYETTGGVLDRTAPAPTTMQVGTATIAFSSCSSARLTYAFTGGSNAGQAGAIDLTRVGSVPESCSF